MEAYVTAASLGLQVAKYYQNLTSAARPPPPDETTLHILVGISRNGKAGFRNFLKVEEFLEACNTWIPPATSQYRQTKCFAFAFGAGLAADIATLQEADIFVRT